MESIFPTPNSGNTTESNVYFPHRMRIYRPPSLGESLRDARKRKKLTQAQLARVTGVSRRHLAAVEEGANVSIAVLLKLAMALEIPELTIDAVTLHFDNPPLDTPPGGTDRGITTTQRGVGSPATSQKSSKRRPA